MDDRLPTNSRRVSHRRAPPEVWDRIREDFLSGLPAAECARRHGVGVSTISARAAAEGWRRADQPWGDPLGPEDEGRILDEEIGGDLDQTDLGELAHVAIRRMMRAVLKGDAVAALRWRRVHHALEKQDEELQRRLWLFQRDHPEAVADLLTDLTASRGEQEQQDEQEQQEGVFQPPGIV